MTQVDASQLQGLWEHRWVAKRIKDGQKRTNMLYGLLQNSVLQQRLWSFLLRSSLWERYHELQAHQVENCPHTCVAVVWSKTFSDVLLVVKAAWALATLARFHIWIYSSLMDKKNSLADRMHLVHFTELRRLSFSGSWLAARPRASDYLSGIEFKCCKKHCFNIFFVFQLDLS